jgi:steroid Delta-isomerase
MPAPRHHLPHVHAAIVYFETLQRADVTRLGQFFHPQARFKDPFNEVQGLAPIQQIFGHMFDQVDEPRFVIHQAVAEGRQCFVSWDFMFRQRSGKQQRFTVRGATHWQFDSDGLIIDHRDYWDVAEELYAKLPVLGALMRWLRKQGSAT